MLVPEGQFGCGLACRDFYGLGGAVQHEAVHGLDLLGGDGGSGFQPFQNDFTGVIAIGSPPLLRFPKGNSSQSGFSPASHRACDFHRTRRSINTD